MKSQVTKMEIFVFPADLSQELRRKHIKPHVLPPGLLYISRYIMCRPKPRFFKLQSASDIVIMSLLSINYCEDYRFRERERGEERDKSTMIDEIAGDFRIGFLSLHYFTG
jgi:hypothetical protein